MNDDVLIERRMENIAQQIESAVKIEFLSKKFDELSEFVKEHMKNEDVEREKINNKLLLIAAVVLVDTVAPGGGAAVLKTLL